MKIVFLTHNIFTESVGGIEYHIFQLSKALCKHKISITIVVPILSEIDGFEDYYEDEVLIRKIYIGLPVAKYFKKIEKYHDAGIGLGIALFNKIKMNFFCKRVYNEIDALKPDIIHQHDYLSNILVTKLLAKKYPIIFTNHTGQYLYLQKYKLTRLLQQHIIKHYKHVIGPSKELTPVSENSSYVPNGVDVDYFVRYDDNRIKDLKKQFNVEDNFVFLCPRRWAPTKGIIFLAQAINALDENVARRCLFLFAGSSSNDYAKYSKNVLRVLSSGRTKNWRLLGNLSPENLRDVYNISDVVIIPSLMEATSLAALEAMACGVPILTTNVGGMPEIVSEMKNGWLVKSGEPVFLKQRIEDIVNHNYNLLQMGEQGKCFVNENMSWEKVADITYKIYQSTLISKMM